MCHRRPRLSGRIRGRGRDAVNALALLLAELELEGGKISLSNLGWEGGRASLTSVPVADSDIRSRSLCLSLSWSQSSCLL